MNVSVQEQRDLKTLNFWCGKVNVLIQHKSPVKTDVYKSRKVVGCLHNSASNGTKFKASAAPHT